LEEIIVTKLDRFIFYRLTILTLMVILVLIFVFIVIDFSENSDNFTDRGATLSDIWNRYYLNYIPEIIRLVSPLAVFVSVLLIVGHMTERSELIAIKSSGVSLYRFMIPFLLFATIVTGIVSYLDGYIIPKSNADRIEFEREFITRGSQRVERHKIYRQDTPQSLIVINYFDSSRNIAYGVSMFTFEGNELVTKKDVVRMEWVDTTSVWTLTRADINHFHEQGMHKMHVARMDTTLNILPRDLHRTTADIYLLTYPEIVDYIRSLRRSGAAGIEVPMVQFYGKASYPLGILIITIIGIAVASERRKGGKGAIFGLGLAISFLYIALMKIIEPFGASGSLEPLHAALLPHAIFFLVSMILLIRAPK